MSMTDDYPQGPTLEEMMAEDAAAPTPAPVANPRASIPIPSPVGFVNVDPAEVLTNLYMFTRAQRTAAMSERYNGTSRSELVARTDAWNEIIREARAAGATNLHNPVDEELGFVLGDRGFEVPWYMADQSIITPYTRARGRLAQLAVDDPERYGALFERSSPEAIEARVTQLRTESFDAMADMMADRGIVEQFGMSLYLLPGTIIGGLSSGSIEQVSQFGATGGAGIGLNAFERFVVGGFANVVTQVPMEPVLAEEAARRGEYYGPENSAFNYGVNTLFGGLLNILTGGRAPTSSLRPIHIRPTPPDAPEVDIPGGGARVGENNVTPNPNVAGSAAAVDQSAAQRELATALEAARRLGGLEQARQELEATATITDLAERIQAINGLGDVEARIAAADAEVRGNSVVGEAGPVPRPDPDQPSMFEETVAPVPGRFDEVTFQTPTGPVQRMRGFEVLGPEQISGLRFEPRMFQFRAAGRDNPTGNTERLNGVGRFDPDSAGEIRVFVNEAGERFVADGHQRVNLEKRLIAEGRGAEISQRAYIYRERDGWTPQEVSDLAAQANMRQGTADAVDVATLLRRAPQLIDNTIPLDRNMKVAQHLANLSNEAWAFVRDGRLEARFGAIIASENVPASKQQAMAAYFAEEPPGSLETARMIASIGAKSDLIDEASAQFDMFGAQASLSALRNRVEIMRGALAMLRQEKRIFQMANDRAAQLEEAGNVIARDANERNKELANLLVSRLEALANTHGPVSNLLTGITERAAREAMSAKKAARLFADDLIGLVEERGLNGLVEAAPPRPAPAPLPQEMSVRTSDAALAAQLQRAATRDDQIFGGELEELAVERAYHGASAEALADDAVVPPDLLARVEQAMERLGIDDDPTVAEVAARILARGMADEAMVAAARARSVPQGVEGNRPTTFQQAFELDSHGDDIDVGAFTDANALSKALNRATLPELHAAARDMGLHADGYASRGEYVERLIGAWWDSLSARQGDGDYAAIPTPEEQLNLLPTTGRSQMDIHLIELGGPVKVEGQRVTRRNIVEITEQMQSRGHFADVMLGDAIRLVRQAMDRLEKKYKVQWAKITAIDTRSAILRVQAANDEIVFNLLFPNANTGRAKMSMGRVAARMQMEPIQVRAAARRHQARLLDAADLAYATALDFPASFGRQATLRDVIEADVVEVSAGKFRQATTKELLDNLNDKFESADTGWETTNIQVYMSQARRAIRRAAADEGGLERLARLNDMTVDALREFAGTKGALRRRASSRQTSEVARELMREALRLRRVAADPTIARLVQAARLGGSELSEGALSSMASRIRREAGIGQAQRARNPFIGPEMDAEIVRLYNLGMSAKDLADELSRTHPKWGHLETPFVSQRLVRAREMGAKLRAPKKGSGRWDNALGDDEGSGLTVDEALAALEGSDPGFWSGQIRNGRVVIVKTADDLPTDGFGELAMAASRSAETRQEVISRFTAFGARPGQNAWSWRGADGTTNAAWVNTNRGARGPGEVSFGTIQPGAEWPTIARLSKQNVRGSLEILNVVLSVIGEDLRLTNRPILWFRAADNARQIVGMPGTAGSDLKDLYSRMMLRMGPPPGYTVGQVQTDGGRSFAFIRNDLVDDTLGFSESVLKVSELWDEKPYSGVGGGGMEAESRMWRGLGEAAQQRPRYRSPEQARTGRKIAGQHIGGVAYIVADNVTALNVRSYAIHEMTHVIVGEWSDLKRAQFHSEVARLVHSKEPDPALEGGYREAVLRGVPEDKLYVEAFAYAMQHENPALYSRGLVALVRRIVSRVRYEMIKIGFDVGTLSFDDMRGMAMAAMTSRPPIRDAAPPKMEFFHDYPDAKDPLRAARSDLEAAQRESASYRALRDCT